MQAPERIGLVLVLALGLAATTLAVRIAAHHETAGTLGLELGRVRPTRLEPSTVARLERLREQVLITYYVSAPERMPSHMRDLERGVTDLLSAMRAHAPERFDFQVVDPDRDPELAGFAAQRRVTPFRVRSVTRDAWDERNVWSTLAISVGTRPEILFAGLVPERLPGLQATLVAWLDQIETPRRPAIVLAAPPGYDRLAQSLAERGGLVRASLDQGTALPTADLLVWMEPRGVDATRLRQLERFLERGGSVIVAGARNRIAAGDLTEGPDGPRIALTPTPSGGIDVLFPHFGLRTGAGLVLDARHDSLEVGGQVHEARFLIRCIAPNQDFHSFRGQPNGTLLFAAPTPLHPDDAVLRAGGWTADVLATTSDETWIVAAPAPPVAPLSFESWTPLEEDRVAKQALAVALTHRDPWHGRFVALSATTPFEDGMLEREHVAHPRLLRTLLDDALSDERLVVSGAKIARPQLLPALGTAKRSLLRGVAVFLLPGLMLLALVRRGALRFRLAHVPGTGAGFGRLLAGSTLALVGILALVRLSGESGLRVDLGTGQPSRLTRETEAIARAAGERGAVRVELVVSERSALPHELRRPIRRLRDTLDELRRAGADLEVRSTRPADLAVARREALAERGVLQHRLSSRDGDVSSVRRFHATALLSRDGQEEVLAFPDTRAFEQLEFRLAFALWRLNTGRRPHVAFASDVPRLSAAEAYEDYQEKGLFAPRGTDVYSLARETLTRAGFRVTHVNPRAPDLPADVDLLVWMQPRRSIEPMLETCVRTLVGGGRVLLAAQHFNIQARRYRGAGFELVHWPQPQTPDVEHLYFPELSIELVREVLFDELSLPIEHDTRITGRGGPHAFERHVSTLPFLIRASAQGFAPDSPITRDLGDQAFVWANHLRWDPARLAELGLTARPVIRTSERTWTFDWSGGWLPADALAGPPVSGTLGALPLAVLFEGTFPRPAGPLRLRAGAPDETENETEEEEPAWPAPGSGQLFFVGCSEVFKDERLLDPAFRGDHLLWNAACALALEPELVRIATRRATKRGAGYVEPGARLAWRAVVLGAGPLGLLLGALTVAGLRRRSSPLQGRAR